MLLFIEVQTEPKGSFTLERSEAESSKDCYTALLLSPSCSIATLHKASICFTEHTINWTKNEALLRYVQVWRSL